MSNPNAVPTFVLLVFCAILSGCKPENTLREPTIEDGKLVEMKLNLSEESSSEQLSTLSASSRDLVAVQVYSYKNDVKTAYAKGLFGSMDDIASLSLIDNQYYMIETSIVVDGQDIIAYRDADRAYYRPFTEGSMPKAIDSQFEYSAMPFAYIAKGDCDIIEHQMRVTYRQPFVARYWGRSEKFKPIDSTSVRIVARRAYAALRFKVEDLTDGRVEVKFEQSPLISLTPVNKSRDTTVFMSLAGTTPASAGWVEDLYGEEVGCEIAYYNAEGVKRVLTPDGGMRFSIVRNYIHPIIIRVSRSGQTMVSIEGGSMIEGDPIVVN